METVFLQTGSNIDERLAHLKFAINELQKISKISELSSIYESEPWGFDSSLSFLNQCIRIETHLSPFELLDFIKNTEKLLGRKRRSNNYQDRKLDIDILFYGKLIIENEDLTIPHPRLHLRAFTLKPLVEIAPKFIHPVFNKSIEELMRLCPDNSDPSRIA